jgi:hypothetical protein
MVFLAWPFGFRKTVGVASRSLAGRSALEKVVGVGHEGLHFGWEATVGFRPSPDPNAQSIRQAEGGCVSAYTGRQSMQPHDGGSGEPTENQ